MKTIAVALLGLSGLAQTCLAQTKTELLYPNGAPGAVGTEDRDNPSLTFYPVTATEQQHRDGCRRVPRRRLRRSGHGSRRHSGRPIPECERHLCVRAQVPARTALPPSRTAGDVHEAIKMVRSHAAELGIKPDHVGVMGFSAGGHLASSAATHFDTETRPDFAVLVYPVITFTEEEYVHKGSRRNLLGENPDPKLVESMSSEKQVTPQTPPTFLFHTNADTTVPPENSVLFYMALRKAKVPAEMHIFEPGRHGLGLAPKDPALSAWGPLLINWFRTRGLL